MYKRQVENEVVALSKTKRVTVRKWKETTLVDIREYYQAGGEGPYKPGKKGISLSSAQWRVLDANIDKVASAIEACEASSQEQLVCEMSNTRRCTVSKYKGKVLVNIREYYEKDGEMRPGMKGASLAVEAARRLVAANGFDGRRHAQRHAGHATRQRNSRPNALYLRLRYDRSLGRCRHRFPR